MSFLPGVGLNFIFLQYLVSVLDIYTKYGIIFILIYKEVHTRKLIITTKDDNLDVKFEQTVADEVISDNDVLATLFCILEGVANTIKKEISKEDSEFFAYQLEALFGRLFYRVFPEYAPKEGEEFNLTDAAIIKAQDDIITEAEKRGITFQEALAEYNEKAKEYVNARKMS